MKALAYASILAVVASACGGSGSAPAADPDTSIVTLTMAPFVVPAGGEVYRCQNFANPFGGDAAFDAIETHMSQGSHHLAIFYRDDVADGPVEECSGLEFSPGPFGTQLRDDRVEYPQGIAAVISAKQGIRVNAHYLNTTHEPLSPTVVVKFRRVAPGAAYQRAGLFTMTTLNIDVPAYQSKTIPVDCTAPSDMNLLSVTSHMHQHGVKFRSDVSGQALYTSATWDDPPRQFFDPVRSIKMGDKIHFECDFVNATATPLTFGESANSNEMCVLLGQFYPFDPDGQVAIDCTPAPPP
jgi:hypothetical protein